MATTRIKPGEEYLGIGLIGPLQESHTGDFATLAGLDLVKASWKAILSTQLRFSVSRSFTAPERFMRDEFGCNVKSLKHENVDDGLVELAEAIYVEALQTWEPRSQVTRISSELLDEGLETQIDGLIVGTNEPFNLVVIRNAAGKIIFRN